MKRLMTTALVLSMLGSAAQAGSAGLIVAQREQQALQDGPRGDRGGQPDAGQARQERGERGGNGGGGGQRPDWNGGGAPDAGQPRPERGDRGGGGDRGQRPDWNGGGRPAPPAPQAPPQPQPAPQAQPAPTPRGDRGDRGQRPDWTGGQRPGPTAPQPGGGQRDGRDNGGGQNGAYRGGWDRPGQDNRGGARDNDRDRGGRDNRGGWDDRGGWDNRGPDRGHQGGPSRDRDNGRDRYDQRRWRPSYHAPQRYRAPAYRYPRGFYVRQWSFGDYLPGGWFGQSYYIDAFRYGLPMAPAGCEWVRVGDDALLIDVWSGRVLSVYYDLFW